ncbi:LysM peptidoglycan-binding domain-containing protein [Lyngbya sp. CCY1209]|uniref:LysM peptidoglycan-binding domain-containing protein n=1 Tax=Lyngbya sp. CCY1209 TaxID=2886103 RepID=UPI002D212DD2|nr:LysM peptidoglycan-binding domain-containing protein [Lyngbya sp. CCY1209]MEB3886226.1 LysM peptidoglycan-binding domain-containing protein [Lyngbya sp. CCY1209]
MTLKITCPVCDRPNIEGNICPNCETDLTPIRQLQELPEVAVQPAPIPQPNWRKNTSQLIVAIAIIMLLLGVAIGASFETQFAKKSAPIETVKIARSSPFIPFFNKSQKNRQLCDGFYYSIQKGDSLSKIARKFYGDWQRWPEIVAANPNLKGRENKIEVGEIIFVKNLPEYCP